MKVRASDADRDATVNRLREAAGEGQLTLEELTDRIEAAVDAVMRSDLELLTGDLPEADGGVAPPAAGDVGLAPQPVEVRGLGGVKRSGSWTVPAESSFRAWLGHIKLDLREAQVSATESHIHARALFGNIELLVPKGIAVEVQARTRLGRTKLQAGSWAPGAPRIVLTGGTFSGNVTVRHPRLWEKLRRQRDALVRGGTLADAESRFLQGTVALTITVSAESASDDGEYHLHTSSSRMRGPAHHIRRARTGRQAERCRRRRRDGGREPVPHGQPRAGDSGERIRRQRACLSPAALTGKAHQPPAGGGAQRTGR